MESKLPSQMNDSPPQDRWWVEVYFSLCGQEGLRSGSLTPEDVDTPDLTEVGSRLLVILKLERLSLRLDHFNAEKFSDLFFYSINFLSFLECIKNRVTKCVTFVKIYTLIYPSTSLGTPSGSF